MEPDAPAPTLQVRPWADAVIDRVGHDPRSRYVEEFWLGLLGPSTTWLLRLLANRLDHEPEGFDLDLRRAARALGLGPPNGSHSPLHRAVERTVRFGLARPVGTGGLDVRRKVPPLTRHQLTRLPRPVQRAHTEWQEQALRSNRFQDAQRRARRLALSLLETGHDIDGVERELHRWQYHPALAAEAATWALDRHRRAATAAAPPTLSPVDAG